jgi:tRNA pseudouridine55 synthase
MNLDDRVILIDKERGMTSFAAVRHVRRIARLDKVGHCGSLDPNATGLLILCTGVATRVSSLFVDLPKRYEARVRFGCATDTYDADGSPVHEAEVPALRDEQVREALRRFEGEIEQTPPMVSALKHQGRRLYELAREGREVERQPRRVVVYEIGLHELGEGHADIHVHCGRGCYVRSIAHDLGATLGVPAHLESLRRLAVGPFNARDAVGLEPLSQALRAPRDGPDPAPSLAPALLKLPTALRPFPALRLRERFEGAVRNGMQPEGRFLVELPARSGPHRLLSEDGRHLLAVTSVDGRQQFARVRLLRVFPEPLATEQEDAAP